MRSNRERELAGEKTVYRPADNYLKLTVRTDRTVRDYIRPFHSFSEADATEALAELLGIQMRSRIDLPHASTSISAFDPRPFVDMGDTVAHIGEWHPQDLRADEPAMH